MEWQAIIVPVLAGLFSFVGALAGVHVDINWIKDTLHRHETEFAAVHKRIDRTRDAILKSK